MACQQVVPACAGYAIVGVRCEGADFILRAISSAITLPTTKVRAPIDQATATAARWALEPMAVTTKLRRCPDNDEAQSTAVLVGAGDLEAGGLEMAEPVERAHAGPRARIVSPNISPNFSAIEGLRVAATVPPRHRLWVPEEGHKSMTLCHLVSCRGGGRQRVALCVTVLTWRRGGPAVHP